MRLKARSSASRSRIDRVERHAQRAHVPLSSTTLTGSESRLRPLRRYEAVDDGLRSGLD